FQHLDTTKLEHRKMLIGTFVNAIYLYDDKAVIALNYKDETKTVNFNDVECALSQRASIPGSDLEILSPPKRSTWPYAGCFFLRLIGNRTRGLLATCRWHVATRGGLRRSAGRFPPPNIAR
ncbi:MAG: hypothetical protein IJL51_06785, partial [Oscillospiraceae bacterium]|nr:hypothetical protein [Oscillospiraceae bacterium]